LRKPVKIKGKLLYGSESYYGILLPPRQSDPMGISKVGPVRARGRLSGWDEVQENNKLEYPDPALPTYEGAPEWVEGDYVVRHVSVPYAGIDYDQHTIDTGVGLAWEVDPTTVEVLS
jgi:hypothetical protein